MGIFAPRFSGDRIPQKLKLLFQLCTWDAIALYFTLPIASCIERSPNSSKLIYFSIALQSPDEYVEKSS
ncbi:hypothetical protein [Nostoc sp.]|uniref:hypothetical protein n=1 Tax=Nostoc sp. TaxID=1180 RepID=UPI002FFB063F